MSRRRILTLILVGAVWAVGLLAQMPQFKSQEEIDAFMKVQTAPTAAERATAGADFIAKYPKSEAVGLASYMTMLSYQQMNDFDNMLLYGGMVLDSNPAAGVKVGTLISLANAIPLRTREFDLDKEEKLGTAEDYAKEAMTLIPTIAKMRRTSPISTLWSSESSAGNARFHFNPSTSRSNRARSVGLP